MPAPEFYINTAFANASPLNWQHREDGGILIDLVYDHERGTRNRQATHWHFKVCGQAGATVKIILNSPTSIYNGKESPPNFQQDYISFISSDRENWQCITPKLGPGNTLVIDLKLDANEVYVARLEPYLENNLQQLIADLRGFPWAAVRTIGRTVEGRDLEMITLSTGKAGHSVLLRGRSHPWEPGGSWFIDGLVRELMNNPRKAERVLEQVDFHIMPMANKDGVYRGLTRFNVNGIDLNRGFCDRDSFPDKLAPENRALMDWLITMEQEKRLPALALCLHNDKQGHLHVGAETPETPGYTERMQGLEKLLLAKTYFTEGAVYGSGVAPVPTFGLGLRRIFGIDALILELNALYLKGADSVPTAGLWQEFGAQFIEVAMEYVQQADARSHS